MQVLHPKHWAAAKGFANGIAAEGKQVFVAGQVGWNAEQVFESDDFAAQTEQALRNIVEVLAEAGARPEHIVRLTWYVTSKQEYIVAAARRRRRLSPRAGPAFPGHDAGAGGGAGGGPRQSRDRGDGGGAPPTGCLMSLDRRLQCLETLVSAAARYCSPAGLRQHMRLAPPSSARRLWRKGAQANRAEPPIIAYRSDLVRSSC